LDRANNPKNNYHPWILKGYKDKDYVVIPWVGYEQVLENYNLKRENNDSI